MKMIVLGIETSCDETSAALVEDGRLLSNVIRGQVFHSAYGGVVPELASRAHVSSIHPVVVESLRRAERSMRDIDGVAVTYGPGLAGSLLVGLSYAKSLAYGLKKPFVGIDHMEAHVFSNLLQDPRPDFPFLDLTVSGGHTQLVLAKDKGHLELLGETIDDAAGEAFDKVAKMLGLPYPGGPSIEKHARTGRPDAIRFPHPKLADLPYSFSFSGLKTSVLYYLRDKNFNRENASGPFVSDVCASFQKSVIDILLYRLFDAARSTRVRDVCISGGVSANVELRRRASEEATRQGFRLFVPKFEFCTDNGAMIALAGWYRLSEKRTSSLELSVEPGLESIARV